MGGGGGAAPPPTPPLLKAVQACFKTCESFETYRQALQHASIEFANGGGLRPPNPPAFVKPCKACFKIIRVILQPMMQALSLQMGGRCAPPQPPRFFKPCKLASKHMSLVETHDASIEFANRPPVVETHDASIEFANGGGGGCAPPNPPAFLSRASLHQSIRIFLKQARARTMFRNRVL